MAFHLEQYIHLHYFNNTEMQSVLGALHSLSRNAAAERVLEAFMSVNQDKFVGKTQVFIAYENAKRLIENLQLTEECCFKQLTTLHQLYFNSVVEHKSGRGFVAIDIDGTALVQKIDKKFFYGLSDAQSHVRQTLIEYLELAQNEGYDIIVLTTRPAFVESGLEIGKHRLGTKPTNDIVMILEQYGIRINQLVRAPTGLKGWKMIEILKDYQHHGAQAAIGILFEDQPKQVNDLLVQANDNLLAFDINSPADVLKYLECIFPRYQSTSPLHPLEIITRVKEKSKELFDLNTTINQIDEINYPKDTEILKVLVGELALRLYESVYRDYHPETNWVGVATQTIHTLIRKLPEIKREDIQQATREIFGKSNLARIYPNTRCEIQLQNLIEYMNRIPILSEVRQQTAMYLEHLKMAGQTYAKEEDSPLNLRKKIRIVEELQDCLSHENPTIALQNFAEHLLINKSKLQKSRNGKSWCSSIITLLVKVPFIGYFFRTHGECFVNQVETHNILGLYKKGGINQPSKPKKNQRL